MPAGRARRWTFGGLLAAAALILVGRAAAQLYVDFQWYASLGATPLWWLKAQNVVLLKGASLLAGGAFVFANLYAVRQSVASVVLARRVGDLEIAEQLSGRVITRAVALVSLALAVALTVPADRWSALAAARLGVPFGESDPRFQSDLGFWVYWLPLEQVLYSRALATVAVVVALVGLVYALTPNLRWERGVVRVSPHARRHLAVLSGAVLLLLAWSYRLDAFETLLGERGPAGGWSWVDHNAHVPARVAMAVGAALGGALVALTGWAGQTRIAFAAATGVLALSLVLGQLAPVIAERATRGADAAARERPYVATRAAYTRRAFAADLVAPARPDLVFPTPAAAAAAVPLWDADVLARALGRGRRAADVVGRPALTGGSAPVLVVAERPVAETAPPPSARDWSVVRAAAASVGERGEVAGAAGQPLSDDDVRPVLPALVHDSARGYLFVVDPARQVAAIDASSRAARLALALSQQNLRLLSAPAAGSRAVLRRDLRERIARLAPFFAQGGAATPAVAGDTLYWIVHLYSASSTYPVSRPVAALGRARYLRHAAVAVVHGFSGRVQLVPDAAPDPPTRSWVAALPGAFSSWAAIPPPVRQAVPPPTESALAQGAAFAEFGERGDDAPIARVLRIPSGDTTAAGAGVPPVLLPAAGGTPGLSVPVTDGEGRLAGLVIAAGGADPRTTWLPIAPAPGEPSYESVVDRLRRSLDTLRSARTERVTAGAERVVPVAGGAAYMVPHYAERTDGAPLLAGVATYFAGAYRDGPTAIAALGDSAAPPADPVAAEPIGAGAAGLARARAFYDAARAALRAGDWSRFGRAYDSLGAALGRPRP